MKRFNTWLALILTNGVATMACAYAFAFLAILGFPGLHATPQQYVQWLSQTFIQLTMLSILAVGQRLMSIKQDAHHAEHMEHLHAIHKHLGIKTKGKR